MYRALKLMTEASEFVLIVRKEEDEDEVMTTAMSISPATAGSFLKSLELSGLAIVHQAMGAFLEANGLKTPPGFDVDSFLAELEELPETEES
jgi:hypothetical protein